MMSALHAKTDRECLDAFKQLCIQFSTSSTILRFTEDVTTKWIEENTSPKEPFMESAIELFVAATASARGDVTGIDLCPFLERARHHGLAIRTKMWESVAAGGPRFDVSMRVYNSKEMETFMITGLLKPEEDLKRMVNFMSNNISYKNSIEWMVKRWRLGKTWESVPAMKHALLFYSDALACVNGELSNLEQLLFKSNILQYQKRFMDAVKISNAEEDSSNTLSPRASEKTIVAKNKVLDRDSMSNATVGAGVRVKVGDAGCSTQPQPLPGRKLSKLPQKKPAEASVITSAEEWRSVISWTSSGEVTFSLSFLCVR